MHADDSRQNGLNPHFVCKKAVTKPEQTPAAIAANNPNIG